MYQHNGLDQSSHLLTLQQYTQAPGVQPQPPPLELKVVGFSEPQEGGVSSPSHQTLSGCPQILP